MVRIPVSMPEDLYQRLKAAASREGISMSALVRRILAQALAEGDLADQQDHRHRALRTDG